jgi:hypothetical protein
MALSPSSNTSCPRHEHSAAAAEFLFREVDRNRSSYPPMFSANCRPGMARKSEGHRRHLDYGEAQSFQDLPLCRFLRLIGDELDAGLAGSSGISVEDFQTHPHDPWVLAPIEHAGKIRSRIASETTYGGWADETSFQHYPRLRLEAPRSRPIHLGQADCRRCRPFPNPRLKWR